MANEEPQGSARKNVVNFDRELSQQWARIREDGKLMRQRGSQLRAGGLGPSSPDDPRLGDPLLGHKDRAKALNAPSSSRGNLPADPEPESYAPSPAGELEVEARRRALELVMRRYLNSGDTYYRRDEGHTPAFRDKGERLQTERDDPEIARSMVDLARAKGWDCLIVTGRREFKAQVWLYRWHRAWTSQATGPRSSIVRTWLNCAMT